MAETQLFELINSMTILVFLLYAYLQERKERIELTKRYLEHLESHDEKKVE
jgi:hypothetical protein